VGMAVSSPAAQPAKPASAPNGATMVNASKGQDPKSLISENSCLTCHRIGGEGGDIGPSLNGVGTRLTEEQIRAAIVSPPAKTRAGSPNPMPPYGGKIKGEDLDRLIQYLKSLPSSR